MIDRLDVDDRAHVPGSRATQQRCEGVRYIEVTAARSFVKRYRLELSCCTVRTARGWMRH